MWGGVCLCRGGKGRVTHEVSDRLKTKQRNVSVGGPLESDYRCTAALARTLRPGKKGGRADWTGGCVQVTRPGGEEGSVGRVV